MSRSKTGMDREQRNETPQPDNESRSAIANERPGTGNYPSGRESWREFPRRSSSLGGRSDMDEDDRNDQTLNRSGSRYSQSFGRRTSSEADNRMGRDTRHPASERGWRPPASEGYGQEYGRYGTRGNEPRYSSHNYNREEGYGRHTYDDLSAGRADHEDFARYRGGEPARLDRSGYRPESREYDEPYNRQAWRGRDDTESNYPYTPDHRAYRTDYGYGGDYAVRRDYYGEERGWSGGRSALRCSEIMTKNVTSCRPDSVIRDVADLMDNENVGSIPVLEDGRLIGIITDRDIVCRVIAEGGDSRLVKAREVMSGDMVTCMPDDSVLEALRKMGEYQIRRIPICDLNGRLRGIIALGDIALEAERDQDLANAIEQISQPLPFQSRRM